MESAIQFEQEVQVPRATIIDHLVNAKQCIFTVTFRKKIDPKDTEERLNKFKSALGLADKRALAKELSEGK